MASTTIAVRCDTEHGRIVRRLRKRLGERFTGALLRRLLRAADGLDLRELEYLEARARLARRPPGELLGELLREQREAGE